MAAVEVTIRGRLFDLLNKTEQQVVLIGEAFLTNVGVGGGPMPPGQVGGSPGVPSHPIALPGDPWWGDPRPAHPIVIPPEPPVDAPHPEHPIYYPPENGGPPTQTPPPDAGWKWGWNVRQGWHPVYVPGDKPTPVPPPTTT